MTSWSILLKIASQVTPDHPLWPYIAAIGALGAAIAVMWRQQIKTSERHAEEKKALNAEYNLATTKQYERMVEILTQKDKEFFDAAVSYAKQLQQAEEATKNDKQ